MNIAAEAVRKNAAEPEPEREDHSFFQSMEQEFPSLIPSMAPEPQSAHDQLFKDATGLVLTITAEDQMDAILGEEGAHPADPEWAMEQEFPFLYPSPTPSHDTDAVTEEAAPPCSPAAQPEEEDPATGLVETITADNNQIDAISLEEEGAHPKPEPDEPAPDEVIYGLPCPAFSPEMIWRCSDDVLTPWPSPSSMRMIFDLY
jgi:hypothetical protein